MRRLQRLEPADAPTKSRELLNDIIGRHGSAGDMISTMAHSPALLDGYLAFSRAMKRAKLPRTLSEKISLAVQEWIGCAACLAAHTAAAKAAGVSDHDIALARQATSVDPREAFLLDFAVSVLAEPSSISDEDLTELTTQGWSDRHITEVVGLVSLNLLTGSFNLVAGIEPAQADASPESAAAAAP